MPCATRRASISGLRISTMLRLTSDDVILPRIFFSFSMSRALLADDHAGARGIDGDAAQLGRTLDHHLGDRRLRQDLHDVLADLEILEQQTAIILAFGEPAAVPGTVDLQAKADRGGFVTHYASSCSRTTTRRRLNGFSMRVERPRARVAKRFSVIDLPTDASATIERVDVEVMVVLGIGDRRGEHLRNLGRHALGRELQDVERFLDLAAADQLRNQVELLRRTTDHGADGERFLVADLAGADCLDISACPSCRRRGRGRSASARIHRASFRPCLH